jgi:hypothetical protein
MAWPLTCAPLCPACSGELVKMAFDIFRLSGVVEALGIPEGRLSSLITAVASHYHDNPYHNFCHVLHVLHSVFMVRRRRCCRRITGTQGGPAWPVQCALGVAVLSACRRHSPQAPHAMPTPPLAPSTDAGDHASQVNAHQRRHTGAAHHGPVPRHGPRRAHQQVRGARAAPAPAPCPLPPRLAIAAVTGGRLV